ncbi:MAG: hypothetical protein KDI01_03895 [Halioglobus sp.]|nr:hypothetical protein [Halioglobus sp.]
MSARFSSSPALRLHIGNSRIRSAAFGALALGSGAALYLIRARGYPVLAGSLLAPVLAVLWYLRQERWRGAQISWHRGVWQLQAGGRREAIVMSPRSGGFPGLLYLAWREAGSNRRGSVWLFADSAPAEELRRLRVRLLLER